MANRSAAAPLSAIPAAERRRLAIRLLLFAVLFGAVGLIADLSGAGGLGLAIVGVVAMAIAVLLALVAWGMLHSIRQDREQARVDAQLAEALREHELTCNCGSGHGAAETGATEAATADDAADGAGCGGAGCGGAGTGCGQDCGACTHRTA